jgi:hypothetical protein
MEKHDDQYKSAPSLEAIDYRTARLAPLAEEIELRRLIERVAVQQRAPRVNQAQQRCGPVSKHAPLRLPGKKKVLHEENS